MATYSTGQPQQSVWTAQTAMQPGKKPVLQAAPAPPAAPGAPMDAARPHAAPVAAPAPAPAPAAAAPPRPSTPDPFASIGGGVQLPTGEWVPKGHPLAAQALAAPQPPAPSAPGAPAAPAPPSIADTFKNALIEKMNPTAPIDTNNAAIAPAIQANKLAEQRGFERNRNLLAERAAANGTNGSGGFETALLGLAQNRAAREGQFAGDAVQHLSDQRDADIMQALGLGGQSVGQDKSLSQQTSLADLDAAIRREGIASQSDIARRDADIRSRQGDASINNQLLGLLLNNDQFGKQLGQQAAQFGQSMDTNTILGLLGGI